MLRSLLDSARHDDPHEPQIQALSARLASLMSPIGSIAGPPAAAPQVAAPPVAATAARSALIGKLSAAVVALGAFTGGAWYLGARSDAPAVVAEESVTRPAPAVAPPTTPMPVEPPTATAPTPLAPVPVKPPTPAPVKPPTAPRPTGRPVHRATDTAGETQLVIAAQQALVDGDAATALALTRAHGARFPTGAHAEERDRIAIEALVRLGEREQARVAADRFQARHPSSIYRARIEALLR
jgi:hypothetical protein